MGGHHVLYVDVNQHMRELFRVKDADAWAHYDQTKLAGAPDVAAGSGIAGYGYDGVNYGAYLDGQGHVRCLEWTEKDHRAAVDVTAAAGAPPAASGTGLAGYALGGHHLIYVDANRHVEELYRDFGSSKWEVWDQTELVGAPLAARNSGLAAYAYGGANHVAYLDEQGDVQKLEWTPHVHKPALDLTANANALPAASGTGLAGYTLGGHHVLYVDVNRHVQALFLGDKGVRWEVYDHTSPGDPPPALAAGGLAGYASDGINYAAYLGDQGRVLGLLWTTKGTNPIAAVVG
jgi:hypothetical protein